jgi:tRNA pseudouridine32 synthase
VSNILSLPSPIIISSDFNPSQHTAHQLRVHLQYLGYPISNDPLYGTSAIWGPSIGSGGIDLTPSKSIDETSTSAQSLESIEARLRGEEELPSGIAPRKYKTERELEKLRAQMRETLTIRDAEEGLSGKLLPREDVDDTVVGGSPIYLSDQARMIIAKLRKQKVGQDSQGDGGDAD